MACPSRVHEDHAPEHDHPRRAFLVRALSLGLLAAGGPLAVTGCTSRAPMTASGRLPPGRSIYQRRGEVRVDGQAATRETFIGPDATVETGTDSGLVFVVGKDAFMLRAASKVRLRPAKGSGTEIIAGLRVLTGKIMSVFGERQADQGVSVETPTATMGIRGTAVYLEVEPERTYTCTCYGEAVLSTTQGARESERMSSEHHSPRYVLGAGETGERIREAPMKNHNDMELQILERLVGRAPPFDPSNTRY